MLIRRVKDVLLTIANIMNNRIIGRFDRHLKMVVSVLMVVLSLGLSARAEVLATGGTFVEDEFGSGGIYQFEIRAEAGAFVSVERLIEDSQGKWETVTPGFLAVGGLQTVTFPSDDHDRSIYRVVAQDPEVTVGRKGNDLFVEIRKPIPISQVIEALRRDLKIYASESNHGGGDLLDPLVEKGIYEGKSVEELGRKLGRLLWSAPPEKDDPSLGKEVYPGNEGRKPSKPVEVPGDEAQGEIDDGWKGDNIDARPSDANLEPSDPKPDGKDMPFNPEETKESGKLQDDEGIVPFGEHIRLNLRLNEDRSLEVTKVRELAGRVPTADFYRAPSKGDIVWVVSSPNLIQNFPGGIIYLNSLHNPLEVRSYDPPFRGAHGIETAKTTDLRISLPIDAKIPFETLDIELYEVIDDVPFEMLTPGNFVEIRAPFESLGKFSGKELAQELKKDGNDGKKRGTKSLGTTKAATITTLHRAGSKASKINIAIIGDGFIDTAASQALYDDYVQNVIMDDFLQRDVHQEIQNSINIFRINTFSRDSGVTQVDSNGDPITGQIQRTALDFEYSGLWGRCWMERGPGTLNAIDDLSDDLLPEMDMYFVVLNSNAGGGCRRGNEFAVTRSSGAATVSHEFGHLFASLGDEYQCNQGDTGCGCYANGEAGLNDNLTTNTNRATLKWRLWVPPTRPLPTARANIADTNQDVGAFPGSVTSSTRYWCGLFRPSWRGRMNDNAPPHNPIGHTKMRDSARPKQEANFRKSVQGDFNGDGLTDLVILDGRQLSLYLADERDLGPDDPVTGAPLRSANGVLRPVWYHTDLLRNAAETRSWQIRPSDKLHVGDFDGDGMDDLYVVNLTDWNQSYLCMLKSFGDRFEPVRRFDSTLPGWGEMRDRDEFYVADFDKDDRDDLMVFNGRDWNKPYFLMLRSTGTSLSYVKRYDQNLPGWEMGRDEVFYVGDYDGDGREEVIAHNRTNWSQVHLMIFTSAGNRLRLSDRYYGNIPKFWQMRRRDQLYPLDFNGDGATDIALFNGRDWGPTYLGLLRSDEGKLRGVHRYDNGSSQNDVGGWQLQRRDRFWVGNVDGDQDDDLIVYNTANWNTQYLGILRSDGERNLAGSWQDDWIGSWNLGAADSFHVADFRGNGKWADLFVYNKDWFGLLRGYQTSFQMEAIYPKWIHNHRYHAYGWW